MKNILVVTDFSVDSNIALINASKIALVNQSKIILFYKCETNEGFLTKEDSVTGLPKNMFYVKLAYKRAEEQIKKCKLDGGLIEIVVTQGKYKKEIKRVISQYEIDLLVFGAKLNSAFLNKIKFNKRIQKIIKNVNIPVMIVSENIDDYSLNKLVYMSSTNDEDFFSFSKLLLFSNKIKTNIHFVDIDKSLSGEVDDNRVNLITSLCEINNIKLKSEIESLNDNVTHGVAKKCLNDLIKINQKKDVAIANIIVF